MSTSIFHIQTLSGPPIKLKGAELHVRSQVIQLRFPFISGGVIWNRPISVSVRTADGQDRILPIQDVTRTAVLTMLVLSLAGTFLLRIFRLK